jgi:hypothetical protein
MTMNYAKALPCAVALIVTSGCETQYPYCEETVTVLDSLDSETPAGVTVGEIFAMVEGQRSTALNYVGPEGDGVHVQIEPGGEGSTELSLALTRDADGELRWIDAQEVYPTGPGPLAELAVSCPDRLEIDAQLEFESADGVFAELFDVTIGVDMDEGQGELGVARIRESFDPAELMGALEVVSIDPPNPESVDYELQIDYPVTEWAVEEGGSLGQPRGSVGGGAQYRSGNAVIYGVFQIATFGD